jgi:mono/diheme cytochrome c family protein
MGILSDWLHTLFDFSSVRAAFLRLGMFFILVVGATLITRAALGRRITPEQPASPLGDLVPVEPGEVAHVDPEVVGTNLREPLSDDELEGRKLERVLFGAFIMAVLIAIALPVYFLREPSRTAAELNLFKKESIERGATLFANSSMPAYNPTKSLACANCHGTKGEGGDVPYVLQAQAPGQKAYQISWKAPALNSALLRFPRADDGTYGRPGTPMQPWGVPGGGAKGTQAINDLVNYIQSIQITPAQAKAVTANALKAAQTQAADNLQIQCAGLYTDRVTLANALYAALKQPAVTGANATPTCSDLPAAQTFQDDAQSAFDGAFPPVKVTSAITQAKQAIDGAPSINVPSQQQAYNEAVQWVSIRAKEKADDIAKATTLYNNDHAAAVQLIADTKTLLQKLQNTPGTDPTKIGDAKKAITAAQEALATLEKNGPSDIWQGQLLFENNCARCHTKGWSYFNMAMPLSAPLPSPNGSGAFGPNLTGGDAVRQFPQIADQIQFVQLGSQFQKLYGVRGIGSGRMPGFANVLTATQIQDIVEYERSL